MTYHTNEATGEVLEVVPIGESALARQHETAALDAQTMTAQKIGRVISRCQDDLEHWATHSQEIAADCTYILKKGGTRIVGPSIRFAELLQAAFRHIAVDSFIEDEARDHVVVGAVARDLFQNTAVRTRVRRNILKSDGTRYGADMVQTTIQAATSLAIRNAIIRLVPRALWIDVWIKSRAVAQGEDPDTGKPVIPFTERVGRAFSFLASLGATEDQVLAYLGKRKRSDLDADDMIDLQNKARAIKAGEVDVDGAFPPPEEKEEAGKASAADMNDRIDSAKAGKKKASKKKGSKKKAPRKKKEPDSDPEEEPEDEQVEEPAEDEVPDVEL